LEGVGDAIGPFVGPAEHAFDHADADQLAQAPARKCNQPCVPIGGGDVSPRTHQKLT
jgi:hypothetical protein